jgi:hypothetical protein
MVFEVGRFAGLERPDEIRKKVQEIRFNVHGSRLNSIKSTGFTGHP